jgi:CheY-like chemotaxis protein
MEQRFTILLVDDDEDDLVMFERAIRKAGVPALLRTARDGLEGLEYIEGIGKYADRETYPIPSVLILDLKMPRLSGMELLSWIHEHVEYQVIPTIVMSSSSLQSDVRKAYELGANTYMVKTQDLRLLTRRIQLLYEYWMTSAKPSVEPSPFTSRDLTA